jgi:serine/threonine protein phosphatase PrpC
LIAFDGAFFGVFDGHGGTEAATYAKLNLLKNILFNEETKGSLKDSIRAGVHKTDRNFIEWATSSGIYSGTTVIAAFLQNKYDSLVSLFDNLNFLLAD